MSLQRSRSRPRQTRSVSRQAPAAIPTDNHEAQGVCFEYYNPAAKAVSVAGSFNDWQPDATPMSKERGGKWTTEILLPPGDYEYRFVVDGQWLDDPMASRFVANPFGGLNCLLEVKPMAFASAP